MKTRTLNIIFAVAAMLLLGACANDDNDTFTEPVKSNAPSMRGNMGKFTMVNPESETRTGVVEENTDYKNSGEQFYWVDGDQAKVLLFKDGDLDSEPVSITYTASVAEGEKPGSCDFLPEEGVVIPDGEYSVYALYPADKWTKDEDGCYKVEYWLGYPIFYQPDYSSRHLGENMYMKAKTTLTVNDNEPTNMELNFKHLTSIVRARIMDNSKWERPLEFDFFVFETMDLSPFFPSSAYLSSLEDDELTPVESSRSFFIQLNAGAFNSGKNLELVDLDGGYGIDIYFPMLPTSVPDPTLKMKFNSGVISGNTTYIMDFHTQFGITFDNELSYLKDGIKAGESYYFDFLTNYLHL